MISVLLPTYNSERTVVQAVNSILKQTFGDFELLVLDDGSSDNTIARVEMISDARIRIISLAHQGLTNTLNYGLSAAQFDIIARMDADDLSAPLRFEKQIRRLKSLPENVLLSCWYAICSEDSVLYTVTPPTDSSAIKKGLLLYSYISHPGVMFRKNTVLQFGGYVTSNKEMAFEDYETWLAIKEGVEFAIMPEILMYQRYRANSLSNDVTYKHKFMYSIQEPYYADMHRHFGITDRNEENMYRGWREYFYGEKAMARKYWQTLNIHIVRLPRVMLAYCVTFLPEYLLILFNESRIRFRIKYFLTYYSGMHSSIRREFQKMNEHHEHPHSL